MPTTGSHLANGHAALKTADWLGAQAHFEAALKEADSPEAHDGLGIALWWLNDIPSAHQKRTAAYNGFKQRGDVRPAARIASWLAREQVFLNSNASAMNGWFARAERLLNDIGPCAERGWFLLWRASMTDSPAEREAIASQVSGMAREFGDPDLDVAALAFSGSARVALGRVEEGMNALDEAMAAATGGEVSDFMVISEVFCVTLSACELSGDWVRTEHWCNTAAEFARRYHCSFLSAYCRTTYGSLLTATGRWREAESELTEAIHSFEQGHRGLRVHAVLKLADLRACQGRLEEAEVLLKGYADHGGAVVPLARLYLARGERDLARALLEQALHPSPTLDQAPLFLLLVDVCLAMGDVEAARGAADSLATLAQHTHSHLLLAQSDMAKGHITRAGGGPEAAGYFQSALDRLQRYEQSLLASRAKLELARTLKDSDPAGAITWARAALASFERLGAARDADETAKLLRELGAPGRAGPRQTDSPPGALTHRESEVLALLARGLTNREIAERLVISAKTVEHHVGQILSKLGLRSRAEVAAYAANKPSSEK